MYVPMIFMVNVQNTEEVTSFINFYAEWIKETKLYNPGDPQFQAEIITPSLNVRKTPGGIARGTLNKGEKAWVFESKLYGGTEFWRIVFNYDEGWIASKVGSTIFAKKI